MTRFDTSISVILIGYVLPPCVRLYNSRVYTRRSVSWLVFAVCLAVSAADSHAAPPSTPAPSSVVSVAEGEAASSSEVEVTLQQWGVGGRFRPGSWTGIQLSIRDNTARPREIAIRLHTTDADGDSPIIQRVGTTQPGAHLSVWLYTRMPWTEPDAMSVTIHEATRSADGSVQIGRQIGWTRIQPRIEQEVQDADAMICVIGKSTAAIEQYAARSSFRNLPITSHEGFDIVRVDPDDPYVMPDDWRGWSAFETIIWTSGDPAKLGADLQAGALKEWVARGGHLVVVIPSIGSTWHDSANPLADLLPVADVRRYEDARLSPYKRLFATPPFESKAPAARATIHTFSVAKDTPPGDASEIIRGPIGCVAVRRAYGIGMVTLIGIDITRNAIARSGAFRADAFWHRILGKRFDILTAQLRAKHEGQADATRQSMDVTWVDRGIRPMISKEDTASVGVLLALIVFVTYWIIAGPLGFALLKRKKLERHAWVAFVATAGVFTSIAWVGAAVLRLEGVSVDHLTIIDHVYAQPNDRARIWASVFLPKYGSASVTIGEPDTDTRFTQALAPWADPLQISRESFPDARAYTVDTRRADSLTVPARSTVKQFVGDWAGGPRWEMPTPQPPGAAIVLSHTGALQGALVHNLPAPLQDVRLFLIRGQLSEAEAASHRLQYNRLNEPDALFPAHVQARSLKSQWNPADILDLHTLFPSPPTDDAQKRLEQLVPKKSSTFGNTANLVHPEIPEDFERLTFFSMLIPPDYAAPPNEVKKSLVARRQTHTLDLSPWFTQACLIIVGRIEGEASPVPMLVDGNPPHLSSGTTYLRWVYPLNNTAPRFDGNPIEDTARLGAK